MSSLITYPPFQVDGALFIGSSTGSIGVGTISTSNGIVVSNGPNTISCTFNCCHETIPYTNVTNAMSPYTVLEASDYYLSVDSSAGAVTLVFANTLTANRPFTVKDRTGSAGTNNITLSTTGGALIDGAATYVMSANYQSVNILFNGTNFETFL